TLRRRLGDRGLLAGIDAGRGMLLVRTTLEGQLRHVLHLKAGILSEEWLGALCGFPIGERDRCHLSGLSGHWRRPVSRAFGITVQTTGRPPTGGGTLPP